jgi:2'-5' RNA ligase
MIDAIQYARSVLKAERIKWVETGNLHITLKFLGDRDPQQLQVCSKILKETVTKYPCPQVVFSGIGIFRNLRDPRVIWIGMNIDDSYFSLKSELDQKLERHGFQADKRKARPHLTLGRIKSLRQKEGLQSLIKEFNETEFQHDEFNEVVYYESILRPEGPSYLPILKVPFRKG